MGKKKFKAYFFIVLSSLFWGSIPLFSRFLYRMDLAPAEVSAYRIYFSAILVFILLLFIRGKVKLSFKDLPFYAVYGTITIGFTFISYAMAIKYLSTALAAMLLYLAPSFVNIINRIFFKIPFTKGKVASLLLTLLGCALAAGVLEGELNISLIGMVFGVISGFCYAMTTILGKHALKKNEGIVNSFMAIIFGCLPFLFICPPWKLPAVGSSAVFPIIGIVIFATVLPYGFYLYGMGLGVDTGYASILATMEIAFATMFGVIAFGDTLTFFQVIGIIIVILGVAPAALIKQKNKELD